MELGPILHDRATRGEKLTPAEKQQLAAWQAKLDRDESMALFGSEMPLGSAGEETALTQLQQRIDMALDELIGSTAYLQTVEEQNVLLRREIDVLRGLVAQ